MTGNWKEEIKVYAAALGRAVWDNDFGIGIDFQDGCDAFWILPGEITSTVPLSSDEPVPVGEILKQYGQISHVRERALHVLRHYAADLKWRVDPTRDGRWALEKDGAYISIHVGAYLTVVARDTNDVYAVIRAAIEGTYIHKVPSRKRIDRYLGTRGNPAAPNEGQTPEPASNSYSTVCDVLVWMGICKALASFDETTSPQMFVAQTQPSGRIGQALMRVAENLPQIEANCDLLKPGTLSLAFTDPYRGTFDIDTKSKSLAKRIRINGPIAVGDELAAEYRELDSKRNSVFKAIHRAAVNRSWLKHELPRSLLRNEHVTYLGHSIREVEFHPNQLTDLLRTNSIDDATRKLLSSNPRFADECVAVLQTETQNDYAKVATGQLQPARLPNSPELCEISPSISAEMDGFADRTLAEFLQEESTLEKYQDRDYFDPKIDRWANMADWVSLAEKQLNKEWTPAAAIIILLDAGDPRGDTAARHYLKAMNPHHDVCDAEVEIAWRYRHILPGRAALWFSPTQHDHTPYCETRARLGDPVAKRVILFKQADKDMEEDFSGIEFLDQVQQDRIHSRLLYWAKTDHRWSPPQTEPMLAAQKMEWSDVARALELNPFLLAGLLTNERRADQFDEPGMLLASEFLLIWSRLRPSVFLGRLVATARQTNLVAAANAASEESVKAKPQLAESVPVSNAIHASWFAQLQVALAIAWTRVRSGSTA